MMRAEPRPAPSLDLPQRLPFYARFVVGHVTLLSLPVSCDTRLDKFPIDGVDFWLGGISQSHDLYHGWHHFSSAHNTPVLILHILCNCIIASSLNYRSVVEHCHSLRHLNSSQFENERRCTCTSWWGPRNP
jgi:hypothetical protein